MVRLLTARARTQELGACSDPSRRTGRKGSAMARRVAGAPATRCRAAPGTGRPCRIAALLFFAVATAALPVQAQAPAHCTSDPLEIWCTTMTVEEDDTWYGWIDFSLGSLEPPNIFSYQGVSHSPEYMFYDTDESKFYFITDEFDDSFASGFTLILGSVAISLDGTWDADKSEYVVENHGLSWADGDTVTIRLLAPATNTAPTASNGAVVMDEDTDYAFQESDFNFSDMDAGDTLASVKVQTLPASGKGTLKFDGTAIGTADLPKTVTRAELDANKLVYSPPADAFGSAFGSFTFKVNDGTDDSASAYTMTIDVNEVSDEPVVENFIPDQRAMAGAAFSFQFADDVFRNRAVGSLTYSSRQYGGAALPSWLSFAPATRTFSGTPQSSNAGTVSVTVTATNDVGLSASDTFDLVVISSPVISGTARVGQTLTGSTGSGFTHQWIRVDGMTETDISGASSSTYTLDAADSGKKVKMKVSHTANSVTTETTSDAYPRYANIQPATCGTADLAGRRQVWDGTLTVGAHVGGSRTDSVGYGWSSKTGDLTGLDDAIDLGANSYRIGSFVLRWDGSGRLEGLMAPPPGSLVLSLIGSDDRRDSNEATRELVAAEKTALRLHACGRSFDFSAATVLHWGNYEWQDADLIWEKGDSIPLKLSVPTSFMGQVAVDPPTVDDTPGVSGAGSDGAWNVGETVGVTVTFSEAVDVDTSGGTPDIGIELGGSSTAARRATYASGSGTTELTFDYTLVQDDGSHSLMAVPPDSLALNGGAIRSAESEVHAQLGHNGAVVQGRSTRGSGPSASFRNVPESHDGTTAFTVGLGFGGAPDGLSAKRHAASVIEVTGGTVTGARATSTGASPVWEVTVAPGGVDNIMIEVPVRACTEANAVCIGGQPLAAAAEATVAGPPMTARFTQAPSAHDGASGFDLHLEFSHEPAEGFSYRTVEGALFDVEGGAITRVWRRERGKNRLWGITVTPAGDDAVTLAARATTDCATSHAVCDAEGRKFTGSLTATIPGPEVSEPPDPVTASWSSKPGEHDGSSPFDLHLDFSRAPVNFSDRAIAGGVVSVAGGRISRVWRRVQGQDDQWGIEVTPSGTDDVTLSVNGTTDCAAQHAVCAADGGRLEGGAQAVIPGPPAEPITASWSSKPDEHDGSSAFDLHLDFSRAPVDFSYRAIAGGVVSVAGGQISRVWRRVKGQDDQWGVEVTPSGTDDVTVSVNGTTDCAAQHAACAADGGMLEGGAQAVIPGPAMLSVADARVEEDEGATLDFVVSLSRRRNEATTVEYETSDVTARAGEDYTAASGTLTFAANETSMTIPVTVLDDVHDEGEETLTLRLSNASGSQVADGEATGTIANRDPLPRALLARFGRTAAVHVVEHVEERLAAPRVPGFRGRFAGRELRRGMERDVALNFVSRLGGMAGVSPLGRGVAGSPGGGVDGVGSVGTPGFAGGAAMGAAAPPGAMAGTMGSTGLGASGVGAVASPMGAAGPAGGFFNRGGLLRMSLGGGDLLTGSDFALNRGTRGGILSFWSRGARSYFAGREGTLGLDGDVRTTMFGADYARGPMVAGLSLSHSRGLGEYAGAASGQVLSSVTGLYPWLGYRATDRITVWGVGGYGGGGLLLTPQGGPGLESGLSMKMAAVGTRGELVAGGASGFALAFKADALWVGTSIDGADGPAGRLAATDAAVTRFRTGLEGSRTYAVAGRLSLTPSVEAGLRHDGGDAETGAGMDVGVGLVVSEASTGLSLDVRVRTLLVHQAEGFRERGVALTFSYNPTPSTPLGFMASVAPSWGGEARSGAAALWGRETMAGMAHGRFAQGNRLDGEVSYGLPQGSRFVGTPRVGFSASEYGRDYRVGYRLGVLDQGNTKFELGVDAQRQENAMRGGTSNGFLGRATLGW